LPIFNENEYNYGTSSATIDYVNTHFLKLVGGTLTGPLICNSTLTTLANIYANAGTVALPTYSFSGDTNSGMYRIAADNIGIGVGGVKILDISATGLSVVGALSMDSLVVDQIAINNSTITFTGATATNILSISDNLADALSIKEGSNSYITCNTTNAAESITLSKATTVSAALTANSIIVDQLALDASTITFTGATGLNVISIPDNRASALLIAEGANAYMTFSSANGTEKILIDKQVEISAALIATSLTADDIGINGSSIAFNSLTTATNTIAMSDNMADALSVSQSTNKYLTFKTTNSAESVIFGVPVESTVQPCLIIEAKDDQSMAVSGTNYLIDFTTPTTVFTQGSGITFSAGSFTIDNAGIYLVCFSGTWAANAVGTRFVMVNKSSSTASSARYSENQMSANAAVNIRQTFSCVMNMTAGQTINFWATQSSGGSLDLLGQASGAQQGATQASITRLY
jgi:hypothetical protein